MQCLRQPRPWLSRSFAAEAFTNPRWVAPTGSVRLMQRPWQNTHKSKNVAFAMGDNLSLACGLTQPNSDDPLFSTNTPLPVTFSHPFQTTTSSITAASAMWGHSAFIVDNESVFVTGRPLDVKTLLRISRLPPSLAKLTNGLTSFLQNAMPDATLFGLMDPKGDSADSVYERGEKVELPKNEIPMKIATSLGVTSVVTESGRVYMMGSNMYGQCGVDAVDREFVFGLKECVKFSSETKSPSSPGKVKVKVPFITDVALGLQHAVAISQCGSVYSWGKGLRGQTGVGFENLRSPQKVIFKKEHTVKEVTSASDRVLDLKAKLVAAGMNHSAIVDQHGSVYIWGKLVKLEEEGEINNKEDDDHRNGGRVDASEPVKVLDGSDIKGEIVGLECGMAHTAVLVFDESSGRNNGRFHVYYHGLWAQNVDAMGGSISNNVEDAFSTKFVKIWSYEKKSVNENVKIFGGFDFTVLVEDTVKGDTDSRTDSRTRTRTLRVGDLWGDGLGAKGNVEEDGCDWFNDGGEIGNGNESVKTVCNGWKHKVIVVER